MKKSILFLALLQSLIIVAQAPQKMSYQSVVRNAANQIVANQSIGVKISIIEGSLTGTTAYAERHTTTTNANGLFTLEAGGGTPTTGTFSGINWGNGFHYIKSEIDLSGGTNYTLSGTMELMSVPYALYAVNGITTAQADAITALQAQITSLLPTTVLVGTQTWKSKNLNVTTYRNGDVIPEVQDGTEWTSLTTGAWCHYNNDPANDAIYGKLYNWYAVNDPRGLAPSGFHVPTDTELTAVTDMKDPAGFTGLPGGWRDNYGTFYSIGYYGYWWSSSESTTLGAWYRYLNYYDGSALSYDQYKTLGFSVRCVKDEDSAVNSMQAQIDAQADAITAQASTITALQAQITSLMPKTYTIGLWPELGGYVFRISEDGKHGLVAETIDQGTSEVTYSHDLISNPMTHSVNGAKFMDWRLPTKYEAYEMYVQRAAIGNFQNLWYWTSVNIDGTSRYFWLQQFGDLIIASPSNQQYGDYQTAPSVRAVRSF